MKKEPIHIIEKKTDFTALPQIQNEPRYSVQIISNQEISPNVIVIHLNRPDNFVFQPGQYIWLVLPNRSRQYGIVDRRAYSISSGKDDNVIELLIRLTGSDYLNDVQKLKKGDLVEIIGPMGSSFVSPEDGAIIFAGGTGISPFLSIFRSKIKSNFSLYAFESSERPLYAKDEISKIAKSEGYIVEFFIGPATLDRIRRLSIEKDNRQIFISGPQSFVNKISSYLLRLGVKKSQMYFEACYAEDSRINRIQKIFEISDLKKPIKKKYPITSLDHVFFQISSQTSNHVIFTDVNGVILYANEAATNITGYTLSEMIGQTPRLWGGMMPPSYYNKVIWHNLKEGISLKQTFLNRHKDGHLYVSLASLSPIYENKVIIGYVATEEDITDLRNLDKAKTEFISIASHQLRTPLTIVRWYTEMILDNKAGKIDPLQKKYLEEIYHGNERMIDLVNTLLDASRIELGVFKIEPIQTDVIALAESVLTEQKLKIENKKLLIIEKFNKDVPVFLTDPKLLRMVFQNLLSNAIEYTQNGGSIEFNIDLYDKKNILIKISDTGCGIPKNKQNKIFTKFFSSGDMGDKNTRGTGLGLYIVKSIIENFGGKIWFSSVENKGTTFYITLPLVITKKENLE